MESVSELPERSLASLRKSTAAMAKAIKPFTAKVNLEFTVTSERKFSKLIGQAVANAISGVKLRVSEGIRMRKPPDLVGRFDLPRFEEGGIVKGPNKAFDSVMALLKPGEMVVPADVTKQLKDLSGQLRDAGGRFTKASGLVESLQEIEDLTTGLRKLRGAIQAGIMDPKAVETYNAGLEQLSKRVRGLDNDTANLSYTTKVRLAPSIIWARDQLESFKDQGTETGGVMENLLKRILGPARFLALAKSLDLAQDGLRQLTAGASQVFSTLGGDEIPSFIDSMNKLNKFLGLSRDKLREAKEEGFALAQSLDGVSPDEIGFAMAVAAEKGIKLKDGLMEIAGAAATLAKGTDAAVESGVEFGFMWHKSMGQSQASTEALFATMARLSDDASGFNVTTGKLFEQTQKDVETLDAVLRGMSATARDTMVNSFNRLGAVLETNFINAEELRTVLAKAFVGGPENVKEMQTVSVLFGDTIENIRRNFETGDISGMMQHMADALNDMSPAQLSAFAEMINVDPTALSKAVSSASGMEELLAKSAGNVVKLGDGMKVLGGRADANRTAFEKLQEWFTEGIGGVSANKAIGALADKFDTLTFGVFNAGEGVRSLTKDWDLFNIKGIDVLDFFKEFNVSSLLAIGYLGKMGLGALLAVGRLAGLGKLIEKMQGAAPAAGAGGLGGVGGVVTTLAKTVKESVTTLGTGIAAIGKGIGGAIVGILTGVAQGLVALAGGLTAFGVAMAGPGGLGMLAFIAAVLAIGAALLLATPAIKVWGAVAVAVIDGVVEAFGMFMPVLQTFIETAGTVLVAAIGGIVDAFKAMGDVNPLTIAALGPSLILLSTGVIALAGAMTILGAVQLGSAVLALFTGGPAAGPTSFLDTLLTSIANLTVSAPDQIKMLTATVNNLSGFVYAYARLTETVSKLPTEGFLGGLFGGADAAEKLTEQVGPFLEALERVMAKVSTLQGFGQPSKVAPVPAGSIEQVVQAELAREPREELGGRLDAVCALLERLVGLQEAQAVAARRPEPSLTPLRPARQSSKLASDLAEGNY